ncbi:DnaJ domain protein [Pseudomonas viridiflava]|uniref:DnaJ domain protein n=3 Tax=Pseudomonas TaxID=286 RepID=A0A3M4IPN3_PSEVI|nr:DnaJ domain-containing protein [Pseudomonas syringae pv. persicae]RMQ06786.1 DnaJ domain protein [Pseudomonas viridiflava]RMQ71600.1 DnaJ domain protein [Pseudomonas viridiflava]
MGLAQGGAEDCCLNRMNVRLDAHEGFIDVSRNARILWIRAFSCGLVLVALHLHWRYGLFGRYICIKNGSQPWTASAMQRTPTHYELLSVARDASPEQIKKAYRKLAQKLHPDRNPDPYASDMMGVVNASHDVLADPSRRAAYDAQLAADEHRALMDALRRKQARAAGGQAVHVYAANSATATPSRAARTGPAPKASPSFSSPPSDKRRRSAWRWALVFVVFCAAGAWMGYDPDAGKAFVPAEPVPVAQTWVKPAPAAPVEEPVASPAKPVDAVTSECEVPALDPMGAPWPEKAGYVKDMPLLKDNGWSQITVDNSAGESAVYAKVTDAVGRRAFRHAFVPAGAVFTFAKMDPGLYLLKYKMMSTGCAFASGRILLEETPMGSQIKSSAYKLTLRKLQNRSVPFARLKDDQF